MRSIERVTVHHKVHHKDTIGWLLEDIAKHAELMNDYLRDTENMQRNDRDIHDGNDDYTYALTEYYATACINYRQLIKIKGKTR